MITEHGGAAHGGVLDGLLEVAGKAVTVKDVVAEYKCTRLTGDELLTDSESLGKTIRRGLLSIRKVHPVARAISKQALEIG